ncbi:MAG: PLP-dependent transferase [Bacteroidales bacterium]|nr:PLP-dependent transferase [Bacteroidales bacterium]
MKQSTQCVHAGTQHDKVYRGANTPIHTSTAFGYLDSDERFYPRYFNTPNQSALQKKLATLEKGEDAVIFSSGMAAITTVLLSFLKAGDHAVFQKGLYGGTYHLGTKEFDKWGLSYSVAKGISIDDIEACIQSNTKLIFIESPSNPLLIVTDIAAVAQMARLKGIITIIDNTFASPINQNPLELGIDVVVHSATKYLGGHSDICAGVAIGSAKHMKKVKEMALSLGGSLNALMCYLLERSIKTLSVRVERQNENAIHIAKVLENHTGVSKVNYPGLESHPNHALAARQMKGFGAMLSFELKDKDVVKFQRKLKLIRPSLSLGGVETIICAPAMTSHRHLSPEEKRQEGITDKLLRLSVGIEYLEDLIEDLLEALET